MRTIAAAVLALTTVLGVSATAFAHDDIESSTPEHQSQLDDPISQVTLDFGEVVDNVEIGLRDPDDARITGEVTMVSATVARLDFPELTDEGEYIVQYLAEENGHLVAGAISFTYGDEPGRGAGIWIAFAIAAVAILGVGAYFSFGRRPSEHADDEAVTA